MKFQSTGTSPVLYASTVIIRSKGRMLKVTCRKAHAAFTAATSLPLGSPLQDLSGSETSPNKTLVYTIEIKVNLYLRKSRRIHIF